GGRALPASGARPGLRRVPDAAGVRAPALSSRAPESVVLVDAENVRRSTWPNIASEELVELVGRWAAGEEVWAVVVFDGSAPVVGVGEAPLALVSTGGESADDWIAREAAAFREAGAAFWLVTSNRELRDRASPGAERTIGGGSFVRTLLGLRED